MSDAGDVHVTDVLPDLLHGRLSADARAAALAHVSTCAECRAELALLERVRLAAVAARVDVPRIAAALPTYAASRRHQLGWRVMRIAAVITVIATGVSAIAKLSHDKPTDVARKTPSPDSTPAVVVSTRGESARGTTRASAPKAAPTIELATGEALHDLTESELRALLAEIGALDGVTSAETEVVPPSVGKGA